MFKVMPARGWGVGASAMFKPMGGVRGVNHVEGGGRGCGASAMFKVM